MYQCKKLFCPNIGIELIGGWDFNHSGMKVSTNRKVLILQLYEHSFKAGLTKKVLI